MRILSSLLLAIFVLACTRYGAAPPTAPPKETLPPLPISRVVFQEGPFGRITLRAVRWTSDGRYFVVGTEMELQIRDGQSGALRARVVADIDGYVLSSDGRLIVVALEGGDLLLIDVAQGTTRRVQAPEKDLGCTRSGEEGCLLEISADGTRLVVPTRREALLWDLPQGRLLQKLPLENGRGFIRISGGNVLIETAKTTRRFDLKSGADRGIAPVDRNVPKAKSQGEEQLDSALLALNDDAYRDVTWAPGDDAWAVASDRRLALWGRQGPMKVIPFDPKRLSSFGHTLVTWSRDGSRVAVGCIGVFFVFKAPEGTLLHQIEGSGAMAPDGTRVALFRDNALIMVDIKSGKEQAVGGRADYPPRTLSPEGDRLQLGYTVVDLRTLSFLPKHSEVMAEDDPKIPDLDEKEHVRACSRPSPSGKEVVINQPCNTTSAEECPCIYDLSAHKCRVDLKQARSGSVKRTWRFSPDGKLLSYRSPAHGSAVQIFDVASGKRVRILPGRANAQAWVGADILISVGPTLVPWLTRLSDGAVLQLYVRMEGESPALLVLREDGRFDGGAGLVQRTLLRQGADLGSPLVPLSLEAALKRPGLYRAFLDGTK